MSATPPCSPLSIVFPATSPLCFPRPPLRHFCLSDPWPGVSGHIVPRDVSAPGRGRWFLLPHWIHLPPPGTTIAWPSAGRWKAGGAAGGFSFIELGLLVLQIPLRRQENGANIFLAVFPIGPFLLAVCFPGRAGGAAWASISGAARLSSRYK